MDDACRAQRVKVFFTVDVEIWLNGWSDIDARFAQAFQNYVYGRTAHGDYGLPMTLKLLGDYGLRGVFFVEPMFSARFGLAPLQEVVGLVNAANQDVQLHLHAEWVNEAREPVLPRALQEKRQHLSYFSRDDQAALLGWAKRRLVAAGAQSPTAFRAGSFVFNRDTLHGLEANDILVDSSYNYCYGGADSGVWVDRSQQFPNQPFLVGRVVELPVTVFRDRPLGVRPLHLTACSLTEMLRVLDRAATQGYEAVVIVSHNFELLDRRDFSRDAIVERRLRGLCEFLSRHQDEFPTCDLRSTALEPVSSQPAPLPGSVLGLGVRYLEQVKRMVRTLSS